MKRVTVVLAMGVAGCSPQQPPVDLATAHLFLICLLNCPVEVTVSDEGSVTDTTPLEPVHVLPENVRTLQ